MQLEHGKWELRCSDCLHPETGMASLADKSVDEVITDPPYASQTHAGARSHKNVDAESIDFAAADDAMISNAFSLAASKSKRWLIATMDWRHVPPLETSPPAGLRFVRFGIWVKPDGAPQFTGDRPATGWEAVAILHTADSGRMRWNGGGNRAVFTRNVEHGDHPTQKPLLLAEDFVRLFTDPGDLILDPFAGSGTTGVAAIRLGRRFIGWERDPKYHAIAVKRLSAAREQTEIFGVIR